MAYQDDDMDDFEEADFEDQPAANPEVWTIPGQLESEEEPSPAVAQNSMLPPMAMGLAGILLGGMALFLNFNDSGQMDVTKGAVLDAANKISEVEGLLDSLDERLEVLEHRQVELTAQIEGVAGDTQAAFDAFGMEIKRNRENLNRYSSSLVELATSIRQRTTVASPTQPQRAASAAQNEPASAPVEQSEPLPAPERVVPAVSGGQGQRVHEIEPGDSFWVLARRYEVSVDAIQLANPSVNPSRLQLGQKIIIPQSE